MSEISGFLTGFTQSVDKYLQLGTQYGLDQKKKEYENQLANESAMAKEQRELANQKELKTFDTEQTNITDQNKIANQGYMTPEYADSLIPGAGQGVRDWMESNDGKPMPIEKGFEGLKLAMERLKADMGAKKEAQPKEFQFKAGGYYKRAAQGHQDLEKLEKRFDATAYENLAQGKLPQFMRGNDYKHFQQTRDNFITAYLRRDSGAAIAPSEYETADRQFFPMPGDSKELLIQKRRNRVGVITSLKAEAEGKAVDLTVPADTEQTVKPEDPLGIL